LISILSFVYVLAQEPEAAITNLGILTTKESGLNYKFDWGETEITLHKEGNIFADIYIQNKGNGKGWKFGTTDDVHGTATYKYILESTDNLILLEKQRFDEKENLTYKYPVVYNYYHNPEDEWNEYRHIYSFEDVCSKEHAECEWKFENNILELSFVSDGNIDPAIENVSGCRTLSTANQYYQLNKSIVVTSGDCIVINNNSITLDCHGYSITSSYNVSGVYFNQPNTTIKNCNISMGTGSGGYGIEINGGTYGNASGSYIYNNTLNNQYNGIRMIGGFAVYYENLRVEKVTANSNADTGIYISPTKPLNNSVFKDITANSNGNAGIYLTSGSNNTFTNITANSNSVYGIDYSSGSYNTFAEITANSNVVGMSIGSSNDILTNLNLHSNEWGLSIFADFHNVSDSNISNSSTNDVWIGSSDNVFLNVSYNISEENVDSGSLIRKWYYRAYVNDTYGNDVLGANISIYNVSGNYMYNMATDTDGYTSIYNIIDYVNNGTAKIYYSNYTINASHPNYIVKTKTHNVAQEQNILNDNFELTQSTEIGTCGILYLANTEYNQTTNIVQTENADCIVISAQNITYNGNGYSITSDYAVSGIYSDQYNITIKNCNISMGTGGGGTGIELDGSTAIGGIAKQAKIYNNTLNSQNQGLSITQTNNSIIENNTINSNAGYGINFATTGNNNLTNNNISLNAGGGGLFFW